MSLFTTNDLKKMGVVKEDKVYKTIAPSKRKPVQHAIEFEELKSCVPSSAIFIPGEVRSKKNSKQIIPKKDGGYFIISSKQVQEYTKATKPHYQSLREKFLEMSAEQKKPFKLCFYFVFSTKRKWDYVNMAQLPLDLMIDEGWLAGDDWTEVIPVFKGFEINKDNPGLYVYYE